jgi:hypothetical protein
MHNMNRGGLDRRSGNGGSKVPTKRTKAISGLIGFRSTFLDVIEAACLEHTRGAL